MQGVLQEVDQEAAGLPVPGQQGVRGDQTREEPVSVLPPPEVPGHGHEVRQPKGGRSPGVQEDLGQHRGGRHQETEPGQGVSGEQPRGQSSLRRL